MKVITREQLIKKLERAYPEMNCMLTEDFNGTEGGIWVSGEDGIVDRKGNYIFDYWNSSEQYVFGVIGHLDAFLKRNGWFAQWHDAGTMMIYLI